MSAILYCFATFFIRFLSYMMLYLSLIYYRCAHLLLPGTAWTRRSSTTSCHQIQSAVIGVIGVGLGEVWDCYWLVRESRNHCTGRNSFPQTPLIFVSSYANWDYCIRVFLPRPPWWKKLHWPLLSIASICEQLSLLQMEMRPKIATNGAMPLNADVLCSSPRVHMPDQINFNPSADRTDISFTNPPLQQFVFESRPREQLYVHTW